MDTDVDSLEIELQSEFLPPNLPPKDSSLNLNDMENSIDANQTNQQHSVSHQIVSVGASYNSANVIVTSVNSNVFVYK